ncbi:MAG: hypothetical protein C4321_09280, partial [Chloroflexota bacterium]
MLFFVLSEVRLQTFDKGDVIHPNTRGSLGHLFLSSLALLGLLTGVWAQGLTGQISGTVTDSNGAVVANASLTLTNLQTRQTRTTTSNGEGRFVFPELLPGTFTLKIEASGFKKFEQGDLVVSAAERVSLPPISNEAYFTAVD